MKIPDVYIEELARDEIAGMVGHDIQKPGFVLGIAQGSDSLDVNVGNFHMFKISGWILVSPTWPAGLGPADHPGAAREEEEKAPLYVKST